VCPILYRHYALHLLFFLAFGSQSAVLCASETPEPSPIFVGYDSNQSSPALYGANLFFKSVGNLANLAGIYLVHTNTTTGKSGNLAFLSTDPHVTVSGNKVVWQEHTNALPGFNYELVYHNLDSGSFLPLELYTPNQPTPDISGDIIVFQNDLNISYYNLRRKELQAVTLDSYEQQNPKVSGNIIVWQDMRHGNWDIYLYDLSNRRKLRITEDPNDQIHPNVWGNTIVWQDMRNGNADIFVYDILRNETEQITLDDADQLFPDISGSRIVWEDHRTPQPEIFLYDLSNDKERQITFPTAETRSKAKPKIHDGRVIWEQNDKVYESETLFPTWWQRIYQLTLPKQLETGLVDDFEGNQDIQLEGRYDAFGEKNLEQLASGYTREEGHQSEHARYLHHTVKGGKAWGSGVVKRFAAEPIDVRNYDTLELWFKSAHEDPVRTFDVNFVFKNQYNGDESIHSLKSALEPTLASAFNTWKKLSIPLIPTHFDEQTPGVFDLTRLKRIQFLIRHNGAGNDAERMVYFDNIRFNTETNRRGLVDNFEEMGDPLFMGEYFVFGESNLGQNAAGITTDAAHNSTHAYFLRHSPKGGTVWGVGLVKSFSVAAVDASKYDTLELWFKSAHDDPIRTFDVSLAFTKENDRSIAIHSLKKSLEPTLASAFNDWQKLSISLAPDQFEEELPGPFALKQLKRIEFFIRHNEQGNDVERMVYFDDVRFIPATHQEVLEDAPEADGAASLANQ